MKMRLKMKNRSHRYDISWPRPRHGHTNVLNINWSQQNNGYMY